MKRRKFISTTIVGSIGLCTFTTYAREVDSVCSSGSMLDLFFKTIDAKPYPLSELHDVTLLNTYKTKQKSWVSIGYKPIGDSFFLCKNDSYALFPIELFHDKLGQIDFAILCFQKTDDDTDWHDVQSLSGGAIDALTKAITSESNNITKFSDYILPVYTQALKKTNEYLTREGKVNIKVKYSSEYRLVNAQIFEKDTLIWQKDYKTELI